MADRPCLGLGTHLVQRWTECNRRLAREVLACILALDDVGSPICSRDHRTVSEPDLGGCRDRPSRIVGERAPQCRADLSPAGNTGRHRPAPSCAHRGNPRCNTLREPHCPVRTSRDPHRVRTWGGHRVLRDHPARGDAPDAVAAPLGASHAPVSALRDTERSRTSVDLVGGGELAHRGCRR